MRLFEWTIGLGGVEGGSTQGSPNDHRQSVHWADDSTVGKGAAPGNCVLYVSLHSGCHQCDDQISFSTAFLTSSLATSSGFGQGSALVIFGQVCSVEYAATDVKHEKKIDWVCSKVDALFSLHWSAMR